MKPSDDWQKWEPHGTETQPDNWDGFGEGPDEQFRRWEGSKRWEITVPVGKIISAVKRLFKRK